VGLHLSWVGSHEAIFDGHAAIAASLTARASRQAGDAVQAAILRDTSLRPPGLLLRIRTESMETTGFMESLVQLAGAIAIRSP
jgi:hypothetical protein